LLRQAVLFDVEHAGENRKKNSCQYAMMEMPLSEDDYILTNQRTGTKANIRKNDFEIEAAWKWLRELQTAGKVKQFCVCYVCVQTSFLRDLTFSAARVFSNLCICNRHG
jgi:hypothetical protein